MGKYLNNVVGGATLVLLIAFVVIAVVPTNSAENRKMTPLMILLSDGKNIGNAAQQYFLTTEEKSVTLAYDPLTGAITGPLTTWVKHIGKGYTFPDTTIESDNPAAFRVSHPGVLNGQAVTFTDEGKTTQKLPER